MNDYYADDGWLYKRCAWCGKPGTKGEEIEIIQVSRCEGLWMHPPCTQGYSEWCEREDEYFWVNEVLKFVRGEVSPIKPGTAGEGAAKIAKDLITKTPSLARPENWRLLRAAVEAGLFPHHRSNEVGRD
jgi:hypothetical protein